MVNSYKTPAVTSEMKLMSNYCATKKGEEPNNSAFDPDFLLDS